MLYEEDLLKLRMWYGSREAVRLARRIFDGWLPKAIYMRGRHFLPCDVCA